MMSVYTAQNIFGMEAVGSVEDPTRAAPTQQIAPTSAPFSTGYKGLIDPRNPLFWFGAVVLVTVGAASAAGSIRLGPAKVGGSIGKG